MKVKREQLKELLCQALETEMGGVEIYKTAQRCAIHAEFKKELKEYLEQTQTHEKTLREVFGKFDLDPETETPGRDVVRHLGESLVKAMQMALKEGPPAAAQLVAAECVVLAETKDHLNWELLGHLAKSLQGEERAVIKAAYEKIEDEEDEHLYHTSGWARELWIESLGIPAVLPPPEEEKEVKTAIGAARAKKARAEML